MFQGMHITVAYVALDNGTPKTIIQQGTIKERYLHRRRDNPFPDTYVVTIDETQADIVIASEHIYPPDYFTDTRSPYYKKGSTDG